MKSRPQRDLKDEPELAGSVAAADAGAPPETPSKREALQLKCDDILKSLESFKECYNDILAALAESHEQAVQTLRTELQQLKDAIPHLENKSLKRLKLAGTLTAIENESQKAKLKAALRRKKDLTRIDDFLDGAIRTLRALNEKTPSQDAT